MCDLNLEEECYWCKPDRWNEPDRARGEVYKEEVNPKTGESYKTREIKTCPRCRGRGYVPSEFGKKMIEFIETYFTCNGKPIKLNNEDMRY